MYTYYPAYFAVYVRLRILKFHLDDSHHHVHVALYYPREFFNPFRDIFPIARLSPKEA